MYFFHTSATSPKTGELIKTYRTSIGSGDSTGSQKSRSEKARSYKFEDDKDVLRLFNKYKIKNNEEAYAVPLSSLLQTLSARGIHIFHDERLYKSRIILPRYSDVVSPETTLLSPLVFKQFIDGARDILIKALTHNLIIPKFDDFRDMARLFFEALSVNKDGEVASSIPHLKKQNPDTWAMSICTVHGQNYQDGDSTACFTLQAVCKPFLYALVIELLGIDVVHGHIGFQTLHLPFEAKVLTEKSLLSKRMPINPAMEAGTIILSSLIVNKGLKDLTLPDKFDFVMHFFQKMLGQNYISYNKAIYMSLRDNADAHLSVAFYLERWKCLPWEHNILVDLEFYFQICSIEVNCKSLSIMGATLANGGVNPFTDVQAMSSKTCKNTLSFMDIYSTGRITGQWAKKVGLPVSFSISGACLLVHPGLIAYGLFSPRLNEKGFSVKSYKFVRGLVKKFSLNPYGCFNEGDANDSMQCSSGCPLFREAAKGQVLQLAEALISGYKSCQVDYFGRTILHAAVAGGQLETVTFISKLCPLLLKVRDKMGQTPKEDAHSFGYHNIVTCLENLEVQMIKHSAKNYK